LVSSLDFVPTFMEVAGVDPPDDLALDGTSLMPLIRGVKDRPLRESLYAELGHTRAVINKRWKYLAFRVPDSRRYTEEEKRLFWDRVARDPTGVTKLMGCRETHMQNSDPGYVSPAWYSHRDHFFDEDQLYDLENDPAETVNLAGWPEHAEVLKDMKRRLRQYCLQLPGTFAELKTVDDCPADFAELLKKARTEPLVPVSTGRKLSDKMPKAIREN
jgi:arylsulfatase A-like enzyme